MSFEVVQTYGVVSQAGLEIKSATSQPIIILPGGTTGSNGAVLTSDGTGSATWVGGSDMFVKKADHTALIDKVTALEKQIAALTEKKNNSNNITKNN
jgi:hypothetical protein